MTEEEFQDKKGYFEKEMVDYLKKRGAEVGPEIILNKDYGCTKVEYFSIVSGGIKEEFECFPVFCSTPAIATDLWMRELDNSFQKDTKIWVRYWPKINRYPTIDLNTLQVPTPRHSDSIPVTWLYFVFSQLAPRVPEQ